MFRSYLACASVILFLCASVNGQGSPATPSRDVEQVTAEASETPEAPLTVADRPVYRKLQESKKYLADKYGISWALEDTLIYQHTSGGFDPNDAMVNTLGLFATWKVYRHENAKDFAGLGFQAETRGNPMDDHFTDLTADLGTLWSPNDSTSGSYTKINQLWWGQRLAEGKLGYLVGKIDPGSRINENRFAGSGNTQFFGQPFATNPGRSFPDNGLGMMLRAEPVEWVQVHFTMSDSDAISTYSPFKTLNGHWLYAGEVAFKPKITDLGQGIYRLMVYYRDAEPGDETGWSVSADQNLTDQYGVFLRYGGNDAGLNSIRHIMAAGFSFLTPFGRKNDQTGIGISWTHPADNDLRDEYSAEVYYRLQLTEGIEVSASSQLIVDPSASDQDLAGVFGLRCRLLY